MQPPIKQEKELAYREMSEKDAAILTSDIASTSLSLEISKSPLMMKSNCKMPFTESKGIMHSFTIPCNMTLILEFWRPQVLEKIQRETRAINPYKESSLK